MPETLDLTGGTYIACLEVDHDPTTGSGEVVATMPVPQLLKMVLDPQGVRGRQARPKILGSLAPVTPQ